MSPTTSRSRAPRSGRGTLHRRASLARVHSHITHLALTGLLATAAACDEGSTAPGAPSEAVPRSACGSAAAATGCPSAVAKDSALTITRDALHLTQAAELSAADREALQTALLTLAHSFERGDATARTRAYAALHERIVALEAAAADAHSAEWPELVGLRLLIERVGATLTRGVS